MKLRNGFISNSSSSSFIIQKKGLTEGQIEAIRRHKEYAQIVTRNFKQMGKDLVAAGFSLEDINYRLHQLVSEKEYEEYGYDSYFDYDDQWGVKETDTEIIVGCIVDNFNMGKFLSFIEIDNKYIKEVPDTDLTWGFKD